MIRPTAALVAIFAATSAQAADPAAGQLDFNACKICHTIVAGAPSTVGPNLHGVFGRKAGTYGGFNYSAAMKASGITWDDQTLGKYIEDPKNFLPGNRMAFPGIHNDAEIADLLAYLKQATQ